jgi:hypothetical protein
MMLNVEAIPYDWCVIYTVLCNGTCQKLVYRLYNNCDVYNNIIDFSI